MVQGVGKSCAPSPVRLEGQQCEPEPRTLFSLWQKQLDWKEFWVLILNAFISKCEQILFLLLPAASLWFPKQLMVSSSSELPHYKSWDHLKLPHLNIRLMPCGLVTCVSSSLVHYLNTFWLNHCISLWLIFSILSLLNPSDTATGLLFLNYTSDQESMSMYLILYETLPDFILMSFL